MVLQKVGQEGSGQGEEQEHQEKNLEQVQGEEQGEEQIQEVELYECETGKAAKDFRNFKNSEYQQRVEMLYHEQHTFQTLDFVRSKHKSFLTFNRAKMSIWECMTELNQLVDQSDPDTGVSQLQHALMTAQAIRKKYPGPEYEWFRVVGLIHDLGKILSLKWGEPQWAVVGDTFPVGCRFSQKCVFPHFFKENPDKNHPVYGTKNGIYQHGCGLDNLVMAWGHDEYLYQVCVQNKCTLPPEGLNIIRFHSFYPWHTAGAYKRFMGSGDEVTMKWVKEFNQFDLYSKGDLCADLDDLCQYYQKAILNFFPPTLDW